MPRRFLGITPNSKLFGPTILIFPLKLVTNTFFAKNSPRNGVESRRQNIFKIAMYIFDEIKREDKKTCLT